MKWTVPIRDIRYLICRNYSQSVIQKQKVIVSGVQPTGILHLGNYIGAVKQWVKLQEEDAVTMFFVADLHSLTKPYVPELIQKKGMVTAASLIACGIDPQKSIVFQQSQVKAHTDLMWIIANHISTNKLKHMPQFKSKSVEYSNKNIEIPLGLYLYPVLQCADILLYKATHVPVGKDQIPHLNFTYDLAKKLNVKYKNIFPIPKPIVPPDIYSGIKSLQSPDQKMSKSDGNPKSCIYILDTPDDIVKKVKKSVTDLPSKIYYDLENRPGISNLMNIHSCLTNKSIEAISEEIRDMNKVQYKALIADLIIEEFSPIRKKVHDMLRDPTDLVKILENGAKRASEKAEVTFKQLYPMDTNPLVDVAALFD